MGAGMHASDLFLESCRARGNDFQLGSLNVHVEEIDMGKRSQDLVVDLRIRWPSGSMLHPRRIGCANR
jgi:hypothetical protein